VVVGPTPNEDAVVRMAEGKRIIVEDNQTEDGLPTSWSPLVQVPFGTCEYHFGT